MYSGCLESHLHWHASFNRQSEGSRDTKAFFDKGAWDLSFTCDLFLLGLVKENDNKDSNNEGNDNEDNNNKDNDNEHSDIEDSSKTRLLLVCNG